MNVNPETQVTWNLTAKDAGYILATIGERPINQAGALHMNLAMQLQAQFSQMERPANPVPPVSMIDGPSPPDAFNRIQFAQFMLDEAEKHRREGLGTLEVSPLKSEKPEDDYAPSLLLVQQAMHHLDESVPNRQEYRTRRALRALETGVEMFRAWFDRHKTVSLNKEHKA